MAIFDYQVIVDNLSFLMRGLITTFQLALIGISGGLVLGILVGMARLSSLPYIYYPATVFVNFLRSIPLILVIFWFYFLVPIIAGRPLGDFLSASIAFIVFEASYFAEIIRAGIQSIPKGQMQAALSTGLDYKQTMRHIIIPQALRNMVPSLLTQSVIIFQDTSLAYVIGLKEFLRSASIIDAREVRSLELYTFVGLVYFIFCFTMSYFTKKWEGQKGIAR
ncbi:MAG: amino acid ABC transporter permease [Thermodesulfobacteriota bacterium]